MLKTNTEVCRDSAGHPIRFTGLWVKRRKGRIHGIFWSLC